LLNNGTRPINNGTCPSNKGTRETFTRVYDVGFYVFALARYVG